jgi:large subunit ribosomal protein L29
MATTATVASELRELTDEELVLRLRESKEELFNLRFQMATGQMDNNRRLRTVRRDIGRIYTVMRERELGLSVSPDAVAGSEGAA